MTNAKAHIPVFYIRTGAKTYSSVSKQQQYAALKHKRVVIR